MDVTFVCLENDKLCPVIKGVLIKDTMCSQDAAPMCGFQKQCYTHVTHVS